MNIKLITRIKAASAHFIFSILVALTALALIFYVWYPDSFSDSLGGFRLFFLVVGCDVVIGPCLMFAIFNIAKPRRELVIDCLIIVTLQLAALIYGMSVVAESRPVFVVFVKDRLEVVTAIEFNESDFKELTPETEQYKQFSWTGPEYVAIKYPQDREERQKMLFETVGEGRDYQFYPKYYQPYSKAIAEIQGAANPVSGLKLTNEQQQLLHAAIKTTGIGEENLGWLLVKHRFGFCMALINKVTGYPVRYLLIDPTDNNSAQKK